MKTALNLRNLWQTASDLQNTCFINVLKDGTFYTSELKKPCSIGYFDINESDIFSQITWTRITVKAVEEAWADSNYVGAFCSKVRGIVRRDSYWLIYEGGIQNNMHEWATKFGYNNIGFYQRHGLDGVYDEGGVLIHNIQDFIRVTISELVSIDNPEGYELIGRVAAYFNDSFGDYIDVPSVIYCKLSDTNKLDKIADVQFNGNDYLALSIPSSFTGLLITLQL